MPTKRIELALIPLTNATTRANRAGYFQPPSRRARMTKATIQGRPDHGSRITEIRPEYCRTYGVNMNPMAVT